MKDFLGNELSVGDAIVYMRVGCRTLKKGKIKAIGKVKITIQNNCAKFQFPQQVVKI